MVKEGEDKRVKVKVLPIGLVEPTPREKRRRVAALVRGVNPGFSREEILLRLLQMRQSSLENLGTLYQTFQQTASGYEDVTVFLAENAAEAVAYIDKTIKGTREVVTNKSATVNELRPELIQKGYTLIDSYLSQFSEHTELENRIKHHWQLITLPEESTWDSFQCTDSSVLRNKGRNDCPKDIVALFGENAAGARDGSLFLLQHSANIASILQQAKTLIFLVGIEKVVEDRSLALFQTRCAGFFGMESILLDLEIEKGKQFGRDVLGGALDAEDANREIHIILLDNGRGKLINSPYQELLYCISCKACLKRCPMYRFFGEGRYPKDYLWSFLTGTNHSLDLCSFCQSCRDDCPLQINIAMMISRAKETYSTGFLSLKNRTIANAPSLSHLAGIAVPLLNIVLENTVSRMALERVAGIDRRCQLPKLQSSTLEDWFRSRGSINKKGKRVAYYAGCFASYFDTEVGKAAIQILEKNGFEVTLVQNRCCGIAKLGSGDIKGAIKNAENLLQQLIPLIEQGCDILVSCPSCGLALKYEYPLLLGSEEARLISQRTHDFSQYLMGLHREGALNTDFQSLPLRVVYHNPCHLRACGIEREPVELMSLIPYLSVESLGRGCCGMAGTFGLKAQYYGYSMEISSHLFEKIQEIAPQLVVTDCAACKMQLEGGPQKEVVHPLILVRRAYSSNSKESQQGVHIVV